LKITMMLSRGQETMNIEVIRKTLRQHADKNQAKILQRFFKTGPGEYAEGDVFLGIKVPVLRQIAKRFQSVPLDMAIKLLKSPVHEERFLALLILILQYYSEDDIGKKRIYSVYLEHTKYINNWDLVDVTAKHIVGAFLMDKDKAILYKLAGSRYLWERRIAVISTFYFIERNKFEDTIKIAEILVSDSHDLIHKAVGWMLREVGKRDMPSEEKFLKKYCMVMPRTMLRYAIERFPQSKRQSYLHAKTLP
jgi:3-methyladenine DNA glycosylase AlkD